VVIDKLLNHPGKVEKLSQLSVFPRSAPLQLFPPSYLEALVSFAEKKRV
jgi:hypothetical protein